jgi:Carboxypeptidase regulatory-like domain/TonB dependent receptor
MNCHRFHALCGFLVLLLASSAFAQFSSSVQGTVVDPSGAAVAKAQVDITNLDTGVVGHETSDAGGNFRFNSLPPGRYSVNIVLAGFATENVPLTLTTGETRSLPVTLHVAGAQQSIQVTDQAPVLDTADSRLQMTIESKQLHELPLPGENFAGLTALAPGVEGLGVTVGTNPTANSSGLPPQIPDNFATELPVDASANGRSLLSNMFIVDGLDVTSNITGGTANLSPNPDSIQEFTIQTNTFSVQYGRSGSIIAASTTKSGTDAFHGSASDFFTDQHFWASPTLGGAYAPFKSNNLSGTVGGPIIPGHHSYFFFSIEPLRSTFSTGNQLFTFEDPQFVQYAAANFGGSLGTQLLQQYPIKPTTASPANPPVLAGSYFSDPNPLTCVTTTSANIPCNLPVVDTGSYAASPYRNGLQFNTRIDQYFGKDRLYGNFYRMVHNDQAPSVRTDMDSTAHYDTNSLQVNETHTFSPTVLNEGTFGFIRVQGIASETGPFSVPVVNVVGQSTGFGVGFAEGNFIQHNYRWRDVLTVIHGTHSIKMGYEGWHGDDVALFGPAYSHPTFDFDNLLDLVQDAPHDENNLSYNPLTGGPEAGQYVFTATTGGAFIEDTWKAKRNLTITAGLRWDDYGNPYPVKNTVLGNFFLGAGQTAAEKVANGSSIEVGHVFNHSITSFSPRLGVAWDPAGDGKWVVRGGIGAYHDWPTLGIDENGLKANPPSFVLPTFLTGTTNPPIFALGTSDTYPFNFPYPSLPPTSLDAHGGLAGSQIAIGGMDPNMVAPRTITFVGSVQHELPGKLVASAGYSGSRSNKLLDGSVLNQFPGTDINRIAGDLITNLNTLTRLNPSFGAISYTTNNVSSRYDAFIATVERRFGSGQITASYTHSSSWDYGQLYPDQTQIHQYWQPSAFDVPNRFSFTGSYEIPVHKMESAVLNRVLRGWQLAGTAIAQSGLPFTVYNTAPFSPIWNDNSCNTTVTPSCQVVGNSGGDYNADGNNYDVPDVLRSYSTPKGIQAYRNGIFGANDFAAPTLGAEGNERLNRFSGPGFFDVDASLIKQTAITERVNLQLRFEFFNVLNHSNLNGVDSNLADLGSTFGTTTQAFNPRWLQIAAKVTF